LQGLNPATLLIARMANDKMPAVLRNGHHVVIQGVQMGSETSPYVLPATCDLRQLGLAEADITSVEVICRRRINTVYRLRGAGTWYVLKWIEQPERSVELRAYELLARGGVPVLPYRAGERALLLEDLGHSPTWRLAEEGDMEREETGVAVAKWYRSFHDAGRQLLATMPGAFGGLRCEAEKVTAAAVQALRDRFNLPEAVIRQAAEQIDAIVQAVLRQPRTLNYNDFDWSNLALPRIGGAPAIVFDYHLLGAGMAYSDCRNVARCLRGRAREAFWEAYGAISELERVLDGPVTTLHALLQAAESPRLPTWAGALIEHVRDGTLEGQLREARAAIGG